MTDAEFRAALERLGFNQSSFARYLIDNGDPRTFRTLLRSVSNWCRGIYPVPGEIHVVLTLLQRSKNNR